MPRPSKIIKIYSDARTGISPIFINGSRILINKFQWRLDKIKEPENKNKELKKLWKEEFSADLVTDRKTGKWREIRFANLKDKTIFLFKLFG